MSIGNRPLVIFGVGGLARELWGWMRNARDAGPRERMAAFVVDGEPVSASYDGIPVLTREQVQRLGPVDYLLAVADPMQRRRLAAELDALGWQAGSYVHESALLGVNLVIGKGAMIFPRCSISSDVRLGEHVLVNGGTAIGHDCVVGSYCALLGGASVNGNATLGEGVLVGAGAIIHPGKRIGDGAVVGMGSVVFRHVKVGQTVYGNPAAPLA